MRERNAPLDGSDRQGRTRSPGDVKRTMMKAIICGRNDAEYEARLRGPRRNPANAGLSTQELLDRSARAGSSARREEVAAQIRAFGDGGRRGDHGAVPRRGRLRRPARARGGSPAATRLACFSHHQGTKNTKRAIMYSPLVPLVFLVPWWFIFPSFCSGPTSCALTTVASPGDQRRGHCLARRGWHRPGRRSRRAVASSLAIP